MYISRQGVALALAALLLAMGCGLNGSFSPGAASPGSREVEVLLELERAPALHEPVGVTVSVTVRRAVSGPIEAWLALPPTAAFINGEMQWRGELAEGETHRFNATIAFVVAGISFLDAYARFPTSPPKIPGTETVGDGEWLRVTEAGGELRPTRRSTPKPFPENEQGYLPPQTPLDGSALLNESDSPRLLLIQSRAGVEELRKQGLAPADPWGGWQGKLHDSSTGVLDHEIPDWEVMVALYDRQRATTGYHLVVLRPWYGYDARVILGEKAVFYEGEVRPTGPEPVVLDIVATVPKADWPVEKRPVSPYQILLISYPSAPGNTKDAPRSQDSMELVVRVNGEVVGRHLVVKGQEPSPLRELPLPPLEEALP